MWGCDRKYRADLRLVFINWISLCSCLEMQTYNSYAGRAELSGSLVAGQQWTLRNHTYCKWTPEFGDIV